VDVVTGESAGGVVMNAGCPALEELAAERKHARITNPTAESSLRRREVRTWRSTLGPAIDSMADFAVFIWSFIFGFE
jgi:hypothetical protein